MPTISKYISCLQESFIIQNTVTKKRIEEFDIVKGIAILYVCMRHLCELTGVNVYGEGFYAIFNSCTECIIFLFIFISGYVYKSKGGIVVDIKNKTKQLLVPYLLYTAFFTVTYFIKYILIDKMDIGLFLRNTISNFLAYPNLDIPALGSGPNIMRYAVVPYWYVAEIFTAFLLFIIVYKLIEKKSVYVRMVAAVVLLSFSRLLVYLDERSLLENTFAADTSYFFVLINIVGFAGILMIGTILRHYKLFDIEAYSKRVTGIMFAFCLVYTVIQIAFNDGQYALQFGQWGQYGVKSTVITTIAGFALTYTLIYISYYLKRIIGLKKVLSFLGAHTLDILMLHFGIGELICMIFGFWYPIYDISEYPADDFAWWHLVIVVALTAVCIGIFFAMKNKLKQKKQC